MIRVDLTIEPAGEMQADFKCDEDQLAGAMSLSEAKLVVGAILGRHGVAAFSEVARDVIEEFGEKAE